MKPVITDADTGRPLWTAADCARHLDITPSTWRAYVNREQAPTAVGHLDARTPLWDAGAVRDWHERREARRG